MNSRKYALLIEELIGEYQKHSPKSFNLHKKALQYQVDGGSHAVRLVVPFAPRIKKTQGSWIIDEDNHKILDFWQGHYANILGHNPKIISGVLADKIHEGQGLQSGFTDQLQIEFAEILSTRIGAEQIRFTTSGTLATMYAIMLAKAHTRRDMILKIGGGWHGGQPFGLKGVGYQSGYDESHSDGVPASLQTDIVSTRFNDPGILEDHFKEFGDQLACFIVEPVMGAGGMMPANLEYLQTARSLADKFGVVLIFDEIISGFRFRAGDVASLYGVRPDLTTLGKIIGGGMPVAAVGGRKEIMELVSRNHKTPVRFSGGTFSAHPASLLAATTMIKYLTKNEEEIYSKLSYLGEKTREIVSEAFEREKINVRFAGDQNTVIPSSSLHMLVFPYEQGVILDTPEAVHNPESSDIMLRESVLPIAMLLENVYVIHGLGSISTTHTKTDIEILGNAFQIVAKRIKAYI